MVRSLFISLFVGFFSLSSMASYVGSISAATGEAGKASVDPSESPAENPASLAYITGYHFGAGFGSARQTKTDGKAQDLSVSLTDNMRETVVPSSLAYTQTTTNPVGYTDDVTQSNFQLSMGNFVREKLAFGVGIIYEEDRFPVERKTQYNFKTGFLFSPRQDFGVGLVFDNLMAPDENMPEPYRFKQTIGIGSTYNYKRMMRIKFDAVSASNNTFGKPLLAAGMETYLNRWLIFRWGLQRNNELDANLYTAGLGFAGPKFGVHYAYENSPQNESLTRHSVDLAVPIW